MEEPNIVKEFMVGNTQIQIADNCCRDKTPEQVDEILKRIAHRAQLQLSYAAQQKEA